MVRACVWGEALAVTVADIDASRGFITAAQALRRNKRDRVSAHSSVDAKVAVDCHNRDIRVDVGHANQAGIGQRHRNALVFCEKLPQRGNVVREVEVDPKDTAVDKGENGIWT